MPSDNVYILILLIQYGYIYLIGVEIFVSLFLVYSVLFATMESVPHVVCVVVLYQNTTH